MEADKLRTASQKQRYAPQFRPLNHMAFGADNQHDSFVTFYFQSSMTFLEQYRNQLLSGAIRGKTTINIRQLKPVTKTEHAEWSLKGTGKLDFAKDINSLPLTAEVTGGP